MGNACGMAATCEISSMQVSCYHHLHFTVEKIKAQRGKVSQDHETIKMQSSDIFIQMHFLNKSFLGKNMTFTDHVNYICFYFYSIVNNSMKI
jgi:hypothetical protein